MDTLFFRQPRLVMLVLLVILSAGMSALVSIGRQEDPTITNIFATITTVFPGADPARVAANGMIHPVVIASRKGMQRLIVSPVSLMPSFVSSTAGSLRNHSGTKVFAGTGGAMTSLYAGSHRNFSNGFS